MNRHSTVRMLAIHALGALAVFSCVLLAYWQWDRAQIYVPSINSVEKTFAELSPLRDFLPVSSVGVSTNVSGTWQPSERIVLSGRFANGPSLVDSTPGEPGNAELVGPVGFWIVDIMELAGGSSLAVARGFTEDPQSVELVSGSQKVAGVMQPGEDVPGLVLINGIQALTTNLIVENSRTIAHDGYLVASSVSPGLAAISPIFPKPPAQGLNVRNVAYTFNWIFFAGIVALMWVRVAKDELQGAQLAQIDTDLTHDR